MFSVLSALQGFDKSQQIQNLESQRSQRTAAEYAEKTCGEQAAKQAEIVNPCHPLYLLKDA
jgi:hypothetical protein